MQVEVEMITAEEKSVRVNLSGLAVTTRILDRGTGPVVLMLHGNPDNADEWRLVMDRLSATHRCIAPDFPGYGMSPEPPSAFSYSLADQVKFVDAVLEESQVDEKITLVVHDTGGMVGTAWAAANVHRLRGMVVTNTVAFDGFDWFPIARQWGDTTAYGRIRSAVAMAALGVFGGALFRRLFTAQCPQLSGAEIDRFTSSFAMNRDAKRVTLRQFRQIMKPGFFKDFAAMRARILDNVPCRVLWGDHDQFISVKYATFFGAAKVTILPEAGHWVALTAPDELAAEISAIDQYLKVGLAVPRSR